MQDILSYNSSESPIKTLVSIFANQIAITVRTNKRTRERSLITSDHNGQTVIIKQPPSGLQELTMIQLPPIMLREERSNMIYELRTREHTQFEITEMLDISQATVSNTLRYKQE